MSGDANPLRLDSAAIALRRNNSADSVGTNKQRGREKENGKNKKETNEKKETNYKAKGNAKIRDAKSLLTDAKTWRHTVEEGSKGAVAGEAEATVMLVLQSLLMLMFSPGAFDAI